jgi:hypothetical protein
MMWRGYGALSLAIWRTRMYLPFRLRSMLDNELQPYAFTKSQLESMEALGRSIGLTRREVCAVVPSNMDPSGFIGRRRMTLFSALITIIIIVFSSFLFLIITGNYPFNSPTTTTPTYTPGSRYGSISPNDFTISS